MYFYAIRQDAPCKYCGKNHGFMTYKHRIITANDKTLPRMLEVLKDKYKIVQISDRDFAKFRDSNVGTIDFVTLLMYS